ncbi:hypothetical protein XELAEV_18004791mg [Xenopus laevis]|uniref:Uncharacterized protein n=1 Tax=Xenopus laevis TaxID=8355 RepID=A0A974DXV3_XENLA|nr:hypothetical protein XELAEV_18004791mg [Xenopus laevis]
MIIFFFFFFLCLLKNIVVIMLSTFICLHTIISFLYLALTNAFNPPSLHTWILNATLDTQNQPELTEA